MVSLYLADPALAWLAAAAVLLAVEVLTGSGWLLWASASAAAVAGALQLAHLGLPASLILYAGLTIASTLLAKRYLPRSRRPADADLNDHAARLIGQRARVVAPFEGGAGRVFVDGKEWAAELDGDHGAPTLGDVVEVVRATGAKLAVRAC